MCLKILSAVILNSSFATFPVIPTLLAMKIINTIFKLNPQETYVSKTSLTPKFDARESEIMSICLPPASALLEHTKSLKPTPTSFTVP